MLFHKMMHGLMDADGRASGAGDPPAQEPTNPEAGQGGEQAAKPKMYTETEAQAMVDGALSRKLKGMPAKEEVAEWKKWKESQQSEAEKAAEAQKAATEAQTAALKLQAEAEAKIAALNAGIDPKRLDGAVILAMARVNDKVTIEDAMKAIAEENPAWLAGGANLPGAGGNPPGDNKDKQAHKPPVII